MVSEQDTAKALEQIAEGREETTPEEPIIDLAEDAVMAAAKASDQARIAAREAEPLRTWCVNLKFAEVGAHPQVHAHRVLNLGADGWPLFTVAPAESRWVRFVIYRNGREDVVAMFRESEVLCAIETNAEPV